MKGYVQELHRKYKSLLKLVKKQQLMIISLKRQLQVARADGKVAAAQSMSTEELAYAVLSSNLQPLDNALLDKWKKLFYNSYVKKMTQSRELRKYFAKKEFAILFMFDVFSRLVSQHHNSKRVMQLSFLLEAYACPQPIWDVLVRIRVAYSRPKVRSFQKQILGSPIMEAALNWDRSPYMKIGMIGIDNCAYYNGHNVVRDSQEPLFINTVNGYEVHLPEFDWVPNDSCQWELIRPPDAVNKLW
jgi:hypothetical protein